ncbi:DEAD/DEAH box helicase-like [[Actinomadura] parvosata subsp. kistnae]|nr:DEAD/DEAH box helicase-like [Actinomadura parvosata subsp. kistnae]
MTDALRRLAATGRVVSGEFRPGGRGEEWCDAGVLRMLRRRSLARLRKEVEPVAPETLALFLPAWHGITGSGGTDRGAGAGGSDRGAGAGGFGTDARGGQVGSARAMDALVRSIEQLQGAAVPASALETLVLPARVPGYHPALLDELTSAGDVMWVGQGSLPGGDGWVSLYFADTAPLLLPEPAEITMTPVHERVLELLGGGGRCSSGASPTSSARRWTTPRWWPRCGTSCGRAGCRATRWRRCAPRSARDGRRTGRRPRGGAGRCCRAGAARRPWPGGGGCCPGPPPTRPSGRTRRRRSCWSGTGW